MSYGLPVLYTSDMKALNQQNLEYADLIPWGGVRPTPKMSVPSMKLNFI